MAPTLTVSADSAVSGGGVVSAPASQITRTWKDRIVRPVTDEEENYELLKVQKNARSSLKLKGKQNIQLTRKNTRQYNSYDQI
jgi:hypothetical protein